MNTVEWRKAQNPGGRRLHAVGVHGGGMCGKPVSDIRAADDAPKEDRCQKCERMVAANARTAGDHHLP